MAFRKTGGVLATTLELDFEVNYSIQPADPDVGIAVPEVEIESVMLNTPDRGYALNVQQFLTEEQLDQLRQYVWDEANSAYDDEDRPRPYNHFGRRS